MKSESPAKFGHAIIAALSRSSGLWRRPRSLWAALGIVGIAAAIIALGVIGDGQTRQYRDGAAKVADQINITSDRTRIPGLGGSAPLSLTDSDVSALRDRHRAPHLAEVSPMITGSITVAEGKAAEKANVVGVEEDYPQLVARNILAGRWFSASQITDGDRAVVIGPTTVSLLFGHNTDPHTVIGRSIQLANSAFTVVGVFESNDQADNLAVVPLAAARAYLTGDRDGRVDSIIAKSTDSATVGDAVREITTVLDAQHHVATPADRGYNVSTFTESIRKSGDYLYSLSIFVITVAVISLLIGAVCMARIKSRRDRRARSLTVTTA
ncbi:ABC transporter permease [Pseudonocardia spinosispora]|uniref:ABC transporter permease n=1 Tax=Pseudonocardia spinosispora TaxID=103441 RepID=UPI00146F956F|nr:ABC transporter permease [Pseudonocardia spinosispora]